MPYADPAQRAACKHRYYERNRDAAKARSKAHYAANLDDRRVKRYEQYWADPETAKQAARAYYQEHKEERLLKEKERLSDPEHYAKVLRENERYRARQYAAFVEDIDRQIVYERDEGICGICKESVDRDDFHVDHVIPLATGGEHSYANVQVAHPVCNSRKGARV